MDCKGRIAFVTGAGRGIGRAVCRELLARGAAGVVVVDLDGELARQTAAELGGLGLQCDVADEASVQAAAAAAIAHYGRVDLLVSNAGFGVTELDLDDALSAANAMWQRMWQVHVMAHVYAARAVVPGMRTRGEGYLLNTASAAGLITSLPSATYAVTKHATIALAEWLSIQHGAAGVRVSVLCPQAVDTPMIQGRAGAAAAANDGVMAASELADSVVAGLDAESFLILPHPQVLTYFQRKAQDYDRWLQGMRRFAGKLGIGPG